MSRSRFVVVHKRGRIGNVAQGVDKEGAGGSTCQHLPVAMAELCSALRLHAEGTDTETAVAAQLEGATRNPREGNWRLQV
jgi:hypothetical protein